MITTRNIYYPDALKILTGIIIFLPSLNACQRFETENELVVTTDDIIYDEEGIYIFYGTIVSIGEDEITQHGFCWSGSENPTIDSTASQLGSSESAGSFIDTVADLCPGTSYHVRAYAISNSVPEYGKEKSFTTSSSSLHTIKDIDGNVYNTVQIGDQTWMAENLKVTRYADESQIPKVEDQQTWYDFGLDDQAYCWYDNILTHGYIYGALYTWPAAMYGSEGSDKNPSGVQGVCPDGWHLPSDSEWKQLEMFLGMSQEEADEEDWRGTTVGGKMKQEGTQHWGSPNTGATNESGFNAVPSGFRHGPGEFMSMGISARFWSASENGYGWMRGLDNNTSGVNRSYSGYYRGYSVRCVKDE